MKNLRDKSYRTYSYTSRYAAFPYYYNATDNTYIQGVTNYLDDTTIATAHVVTHRDTLDTLALRYYNNPTLYWVIASYNRIQNPYEPLEVGSVIQIPSLANIKYKQLRRS